MSDEFVKIMRRGQEVNRLEAKLAEAEEKLKIATEALETVHLSAASEMYIRTVAREALTRIRGDGK